MSDAATSPSQPQPRQPRQLWPRTIRPWLRSIFKRASPPPRQTLQQQVLAASLPPAASDLLITIIKSTRLSRSEQHDIARELIAHFHDGLDAGRTEEDLIRTFGDPHTLAIMLRSAAMKKRTPLQKFTRRLGQGLLVTLGVLIVTYLIALWVFASGKPTISAPYALNYNKQVEAIPQEQRAYPLYVEVLKQIKRPPMEIETSPQLNTPEQRAEHDRQAQGDPYFNTFPQRVNYPTFPEARAWLDGHSEAMNLLHQASKMTRAGVPLFATKLPKTPSSSGEQTRYFTPEEYKLVSNPETELVGVLLPMLAEYRFLARCTILDARIAVQDKDAPRATRAMETQIGLVRHSREDETLIGQLVALAILQVHHITVEEVVASGLFDDAKLQSLMQQHALIAASTFTFNTTREREFFNDFLQRAYTDDGKGGGRMTKAGLQLLARYSSTHSGFDAESTRFDFGTTALGPLTFVVMASRSELHAKYESMLDQTERLAKLPPSRRVQQIAWNNPFPEEKSALGKLRYAPIAFLFPAFQSAITSYDRVRLKHQSITLLLLLERHRLATGSYPQSLAELPQALVPIDYFTDQPIRYTLVNQAGTPRPILYALGPDRLDDQGRRPFKPSLDEDLLIFKPHAQIAWTEISNRAANRGDAILADPYQAAPRLTEAQAQAEIALPTEN